LDESSVLDGVFEQFLSRPPIFRDREVLRHDYLPERLPHRENQMRYLGETLAPILKGARASNIFIYGKTGTGKTAVVKYVLGQLSLKVDAFGLPLKACYVNCRLAGTEYRVLSALCDSIDASVPFTGLSLGEVFDRLKTGLDARKRLLVVVLDEIDALIKTRGDILLYELTRINETLSRSKVSLVGISNDLRFKEFLDPRVLSSLSEEEIVFRPYDATELLDILYDRAKLAFYSDVSVEGAVRLCAALAAAEHGDARRALDLLRVAGEIAERESTKLVSEEHVRKAERRIEHDRVFEALRHLPSHAKIIMCCVSTLSKTNNQQTITGDIYEVYRELCAQSGVAPLTQRRVSGLINELDALGLLSTSVISMGRYGRTKKIGLGIASDLVRDAFSNDNRIGHLVNFMPTCMTKVFSKRS